MAEKLVVITCNEILESGTGISQMFIHDSGIPASLRGSVKSFGTVALYKTAYSWRWQAIVLTPHTNGFFQESFRNDEATVRMNALVRRLPDCHLLMTKDDFPTLKEACDAVGVQVVKHHFEGTLDLSTTRPNARV